MSDTERTKNKRWTTPTTTKTIDHIKPKGLMKTGIDARSMTRRALAGVEGRSEKE
jgi:hypothetical protein